GKVYSSCKHHVLVKVLRLHINEVGFPQIGLVIVPGIIEVFLRVSSRITLIDELLTNGPKPGLRKFLRPKNILELTKRSMSLVPLGIPGLILEQVAQQCIFFQNSPVNSNQASISKGLFAGS